MKGSGYRWSLTIYEAVKKEMTIQTRKSAGGCEEVYPGLKILLQMSQLT